MTTEDTEARAPLNLSSLRKQVTHAHAEVAARLANARQDRDQLNDKIRVLVAEEAEAARAVRALTPKAER